MRELKIFVFVAIAVGVLYWGVEPLAHSIFHPKTAPADFAFSDLEKLPTEGNVENGKTLASTYCIACHSIEKEGFPALISNEDAANAYGVVPPDLSNIGAIYEPNFLANLIKAPTQTLKLTHKFENEKNPMPFPMAPTPLNDAELGDVVAYFVSIGEAHLNKAVEDSEEFKTKLEALEKAGGNKAAKTAALKEHLTNKEIFKSACSRCHSLKYDKVESITPSDKIQGYLGAKAPDLSMMIRARGMDTLHKFINDPQKTLPEAAMPRVGLSQKSQNAVVKYLESIGDSKKSERENLGYILIGFMFIMTILAYLWKRKVWSELH